MRKQVFDILAFIVILYVAFESAKYATPFLT
jgi:hypothetical protein